MLPLPSSGQCYYTVAFSPDGRWIAAGGSACAVDVWDLHAPLQPARRLAGMGIPIVRVEFPSENRIAAYGPDRHLLDDTRNWFLPRGSQNPTPAESLADGGAQTNNLADYLDVRDPASGQVVDRLPVSPRPLRVSYSANGERAATLTNGNLSVWHLPTRTLVADRNGPTHGGWLSLAFAPHGRRIVTGGIDSTVGVWDALADGPPLRTFQWGVGPVYAVAFDREGHRAAAAGHCGVLVWDVDE